MKYVGNGEIKEWLSKIINVLLRAVPGILPEELNLRAWVDAELVDDGHVLHESLLGLAHSGIDDINHVAFDTDIDRALHIIAPADQSALVLVGLARCGGVL